jgi:DNA-directed RNA polymerase subunit RPC12/RpoP
MELRCPRCRRKVGEIQKGYLVVEDSRRGYRVPLGSGVLSIRCPRCGHRWALYLP